MFVGLPALPLLIPLDIVLFLISPYPSSWLNSFSPFQPFFISIIYISGALFACLIISIWFKKRNTLLLWKRLIFAIVISAVVVGTTQMGRPSMDLDSRLEYCNQGDGEWSIGTYVSCTTDIINYIAQVNNLQNCPKSNIVFPFLPVKSVTSSCVSELIVENLAPFCEAGEWTCSGWKEIIRINKIKY
jgi:hypothetical protein